MVQQLEHELESQFESKYRITDDISFSHPVLLQDPCQRGKTSFQQTFGVPKCMWFGFTANISHLLNIYLWYLHVRVELEKNKLYFRNQRIEKPRGIGSDNVQNFFFTFVTFCNVTTLRTVSEFYNCRERFATNKNWIIFLIKLTKRY